MSDNNKMRVVLLLSGRFEIAEKVQTNLPSSTSLHFTESQYTCAADLLSGIPSVIAIDLRYLPAKHLGLLDICRNQKSQTLIFGTPCVGVSYEDLNGTRITTPENLSKDINSILESIEDKTVIISQKTVQVTPQEEKRPKEINSMGRWIVKVGKNSAKAVTLPSQTKSPAPMETDIPSIQQIPAELLSKDELSALLEEGI